MYRYNAIFFVANGLLELEDGRS